jgi:DNA-binding transcriptional LysR family regulator
VLFARSNKGTEPTAAAYALLGLARGVLNGLDDIAAQMAGLRDGVRGHVRVSANISAITQFLPRRAAQTSWTATRACRCTCRSASAPQWRAKWPTTSRTSASSMPVITARTHRAAAVPGRRTGARSCRKAHPLARRRIALRDALPFDFVGMHPGSAINNRVTQAAAEMGLPLKTRMQVTGYDALCLMVANGMGFGVIPRGSAGLYLRALSLVAVKLDEPWARRELVLCVRQGSELLPATRLLVEHLQQHQADERASP